MKRNRFYSGNQINTWVYEAASRYNFFNSLNKKKFAILDALNNIPGSSSDCDVEVSCISFLTDLNDCPLVSINYGDELVEDNENWLLTPIQKELGVNQNRLMYHFQCFWESLHPSDEYIDRKAIASLGFQTTLLRQAFFAMPLDSSVGKWVSKLNDVEGWLLAISKWPEGFSNSGNLYQEHSVDFIVNIVVDEAHQGECSCDEFLFSFGYFSLEGFHNNRGIYDENDFFADNPAISKLARAFLDHLFFSDYFF